GGAFPLVAMDAKEGVVLAADMNNHVPKTSGQGTDYSGFLKTTVLVLGFSSFTALTYWKLWDN
ncbi:hypothetical protein KW789_02715, partial [Candidatus Saccharibacteria bacterium]|nr:hypothetical protein [Candidatus Saccharibacteria bacterium]